MARDDRGSPGGTQVEMEDMVGAGAPARTVIDLADPELYATGDPRGAWRALRETAPVAFNAQRDGPGFWAVTSYDRAEEVYRRTNDFRPAPGIGPAEDRCESDPAGDWRTALADARRHDQVCGLAARAGTPRMLARLRAGSRSLAARLVGEAIEQGSCEFVDGVAARLPVALTCEVMGVPRSDQDHLYAVTRRAFGAGDPAYRCSSSARVAAARAHTELMGYYRQLAAERRDRPRDDVVSALATGEVDGARLPTDEILRSCDALIVAGQETARHAIAGGLLALIEAPEQWRLLRADEALVAPAVEELLRWTSPDMYGSLVATRDVALGDATLRAGDAVRVANAAANRDAWAFARPDELDLARTPNRHLALGARGRAGAHHAFAAWLVRLELAAVLAELRRSVREARVVGPIARLRSSLIGGFTSLPLALDPR